MALIISQNPETENKFMGKITSIEDYEELLSKTPDLAEGHNALGLLYYQTDNRDAAQMHLEKAVQLDPGKIKYLKDLADFYYSVLSQSESALIIYEKILNLAPMDKEALEVCGNILISLDRMEHALAKYTALLALEPWRVDIQEIIDKLNRHLSNSTSEKLEKTHQQAQIAMRKGQREKALTLLMDILQEAPDHAIAHNDMGMLKSENGEWPEAKYHYEKAVALAPDNITCLKNLADFYYVALNEVEKALRIYLGILKIHPHDVETLLVAGTICERFQRVESAKIFYENILEIEPWHLEASEKLIVLR